MANDIAIYEKNIDTVMPTLANILAATPGLPARSFKAALLSQMMNSKAATNLMKCSMPSFLNCAATFAGLGLMPDGVTGQAYMLPFAGTATPVIGYKGYNTLGDRAGRSIGGNVWHDGDSMEWEDGDDPWVKHRATGAPGQRRILGAWATASAIDRKAVISVMFIEQLEEVRTKSPAGNKSDSPWMDLKIGRPAMYAKTAKRRLARSMPLVHGHPGNYQTADALEGRFEATARPHYLLPGQDGALHITDGVTGEQHDKPLPDPEIDPTASDIPMRAQINAGEPPMEFSNVNEWRAMMLKVVERWSKQVRALESFRTANAPHLAEMESFGGERAAAALHIHTAIANAIRTIENK